jgi:predicted RNA methylase
VGGGLYTYIYVCIYMIYDINNYTYIHILGIVDGMSVIDLGCGWGSVSLYYMHIYMYIFI